MANVHESVFMAEGSIVRGNVTIGEDCSLWFNAVIRAEQDTVTIGKRTNIQDGAVVHCDEGFPTVVGDNCTIGHNAIVHGCKVGDNCTIGMGAIVMNGAVIGDNCIIGAGSLVSGGTVIPDNSVAFGNPAKVRKEATEAHTAITVRAAGLYVEEAQQYKNGEFK